MNNKILPYNTGSSTQRYMAAWLGGEFRGEWQSVTKHNPHSPKKKKLFYTGLQPINNVMIVSGGQQTDSAIHIHVSILP